MIFDHKDIAADRGVFVPIKPEFAKIKQIMLIPRDQLERRRMPSDLSQVETDIFAEVLPVKIHTCGIGCSGLQGIEKGVLQAGYG